MKMYKKTLSLLLVLCLAVSLFAACGSNEPAAQPTEVKTENKIENEVVAPPAEQYLDVLSVGVSAYPTNLDPGVTVGKNYTRIENQIFDRLLYRDASGTGEIYSYILESWEILDDVTVQVVLKDGITFHDGSPMTASDVKFSFDRHIKEGKEQYNSIINSLFAGFESVEVIDEKTVKFHLERPDPIILERLSSDSSVYIIPQAHYEKVGADAFAIAPIGSGPYMVTEFTPEQLTLTYYEGYHGNKPVAETVVYKKITEDAAILAALVSGEIDMAIDVSATVYEAAQAYDHLNTFTDRGSTGNMTYMNTAKSDKYLRQAMSLSIDRQLVCDTIFNGLAYVPNSYNYPEFGDYYLEDYVGNEYNVEKAKEALAKSSYDGSEIVWPILKGYYANYDQAAEVFCDMWSEIGINVKIQYVEKKPGTNEGWFMTPASNGLRFNDPLGGMWTFMGEGITFQELLWQDCPEEFNELGRKLEVETDVEARREIYRQMVEIFDEHVPAMIFYAMNESWIVRDGLEWVHKPGYGFWLREEMLKIQ